jgi:hypothetical protein
MSHTVTLIKKVGDAPANLLINQGVMATLQKRLGRLGYYFRVHMYDHMYVII